MRGYLFSLNKFRKLTSTEAHSSSSTVLAWFYLIATVALLEREI